MASVLLHWAALNFRFAGVSGRAADSSHLDAAVSAVHIRLVKPVLKPSSELESVFLSDSRSSALAATPALPKAAVDSELLKPPQVRDQPAAAANNLATGVAPEVRSATLSTPAAAPMPTPVVPQPPEHAVEPLSPAASGSQYRASIGLNPPPTPLNDIIPEAPASAGRAGGTVVLRLFINELGSVDKAEVVRSAPPGLFEAAALAAFTQAHFSPGFFLGTAVKSQILYEVQFAPQARESSASGRGY